MSRQARLRREFASLYPGIPADEWRGAEVMVDSVVAACLQRGEAPFITRDRVLSPEHFEFRYGTPPDQGDSRRTTDRHPSS